MPRFKDATTAPVVGEMVRVPSAFETEDTAPEVERHVPFTAKQPVVILKPLVAEVVARPVISSFKSVVEPVVLLKVSSGVEVVAKVVGEEVEM